MIRASERCSDEMGGMHERDVQNLRIWWNADRRERQSEEEEVTRKDSNETNCTLGRQEALSCRELRSTK